MIRSEIVNLKLNECDCSFEKIESFDSAAPIGTRVGSSSSVSKNCVCSSSSCCSQSYAQKNLTAPHSRAKTIISNSISKSSPMKQCITRSQPTSTSNRLSSIPNSRGNTPSSSRILARTAPTISASSSCSESTLMTKPRQLSSSFAPPPRTLPVADKSRMSPAKLGDQIYVKTSFTSTSNTTPPSRKVIATVSPTVVVPSRKVLQQQQNEKLGFNSAPSSVERTNVPVLSRNGTQQLAKVYSANSHTNIKKSRAFTPLAPVQLDKNQHFSIGEHVNNNSTSVKSTKNARGTNNISHPGATRTEDDSGSSKPKSGANINGGDLDSKDNKDNSAVAQPAFSFSGAYAAPPPSSPNSLLSYPIPTSNDAWDQKEEPKSQVNEEIQFILTSTSDKMTVTCHSRPTSARKTNLTENSFHSEFEKSANIIDKSPLLKPVVFESSLQRTQSFRNNFPAAKDLFLNEFDDEHYQKRQEANEGAVFTSKGDREHQTSIPEKNLLNIELDVDNYCLKKEQKNSQLKSPQTIQGISYKVEYSPKSPTNTNRTTLRKSLFSPNIHYSIAPSTKMPTKYTTEEEASNLSLVKNDTHGIYMMNELNLTPSKVVENNQSPNYSTLQIKSTNSLSMAQNVVSNCTITSLASPPRTMPWGTHNTSTYHNSSIPLTNDFNSVSSSALNLNPLSYDECVSKKHEFNTHAENGLKTDNFPLIQMKNNSFDSSESSTPYIVPTSNSSSQKKGFFSDVGGDYEDSTPVVSSTVCNENMKLLNVPTRAKGVTSLSRRSTTDSGSGLCQVRLSNVPLSIGVDDLKFGVLGANNVYDLKVQPSPKDDISVLNVANSQKGCTSEIHHPNDRIDEDVDALLERKFLDVFLTVSKEELAEVADCLASAGIGGVLEVTDLLQIAEFTNGTEDHTMITKNENEFDYDMTVERYS